MFRSDYQREIRRKLEQALDLLDSDSDDWSRIAVLLAEARVITNKTKHRFPPEQHALRRFSLPENL